MGCTLGKKAKGEEGGKEPPYGTKEAGENAAPEKDGEVAHLDANVDLDPLLEKQTADPNTSSQPVHSTEAEARGAVAGEDDSIPYVDSNFSESTTTHTTVTKVSTTGSPDEEEGVTREKVTVTKTTVIKASQIVETSEDKPDESGTEPDKEVIVTKTTVTKTLERTEGDDKPTEIITTKTVDTHVEDTKPEAEPCTRPEPVVEYAEKPETEPVVAPPCTRPEPIVEYAEKPESEPETAPCYMKTTVVKMVEETPEGTETRITTTVEQEEKPGEGVVAPPCTRPEPLVEYAEKPESEPEIESSYTKTTVVKTMESTPEGTETRVTTTVEQEGKPVETDTTVVEEPTEDAPDAPVEVSTGPEPVDLSSLPEGLAERLRLIDRAEAGDGIVTSSRTTVTTTRVMSSDGHTVTETEKKQVVQSGGEEQVVTTHTVTEDGGVDPAAEGAQSEDRFYNNKSFQKPDIDPSDTQQQDAALKIQTKYRQHHAKQEVQKKREEKAATTIQATFRGHTDRQKVKDIKEGDEEEAAEEEKVEETVTDSKPEEEVDIDLGDPEVQAAATKIQAGFRGHKARQEVKELKEEHVEAAPAEAAPVEEEKAEAEDIDLEDPEVIAAATKIQAAVRGHHARQEVKVMKEGEEEGKEEPPAEKQEDVDIDLSDPAVNQAATKIQAGFRGYKARQEVQTIKDSKSHEGDASEAPAAPEAAGEEKKEEVDIDLNDPEVAQAATKIQAAFKGHLVRKDMKDKEGKDVPVEGGEDKEGDQGEV